MAFYIGHWSCWTEISSLVQAELNEIQKIHKHRKHDNKVQDMAFFEKPSYQANFLPNRIISSPPPFFRSFFLYILSYFLGISFFIPFSPLSPLFYIHTNISIFFVLSLITQEKNLFLTQDDHWRTYHFDTIIARADKAWSRRWKWGLKSRWIAMDLLY